MAAQPGHVPHCWRHGRGRRPRRLDGASQPRRCVLARSLSLRRRRPLSQALYHFLERPARGPAGEKRDALDAATDPAVLLLKATFQGTYYPV